MSAANEETDSTEYNLEAESELRFEVEGQQTVTVELKSGFAEMFGTELMKSHRYTFNHGSKVAIFTWYGAAIVVKGKPEVAYVAKETPMKYYVNLHATLENMCKHSQNEDVRGPVVMIVGPTDVGKSTLARILLNYAARRGRCPLFVDLDAGQGVVSIPGSIGAVVVERPSDIEEGFSLAAPIIFHFGHTGPAGNITLYNMLISRLSAVINLKMESDKKVKYSGAIINTCGWVKSFGYQSIVKAAQEFEVDVIAVLDQERLYNELVRDVPNFVRVIFTPKSGGVVERPRAFRIESRDAKVRWYFYGQRVELYPHSFEVPFSQLKIYKIGAPNLPDSCMPIGMKNEDNLTKLVSVQPIAAQILHHILAVSTAISSEDNVKVIESNILGFVCVTNVDTERQMITILSPQPRPLPQNSLLLLSDIQFMDAH